MNIARPLTSLVPLLAAALMAQAAGGEKSARIELIDPFPSWFATENLDFYVRVTNTGEEPLPLAWLGRDNSDLFFEIPPESRRNDDNMVDIPRGFLPRVESADKPKGWGLVLPPGRAYVLSDADYNEGDFVFSERFTQLRVNLLLEKGRWVSSEWIERNILPAPDLSGEALYEFTLSPMFEKKPNKVLPLKMGDETWLFSHHTGNPSRVGRRLCRVPLGTTVSSINYDMESRRMTILFEGDEEAVVINTRTGLPLSGSERTVPHLHLWKKLSGRPFTDVYKQILERQQGKRVELDRSRSTVPAVDTAEAGQDQPMKRNGMNEASPERSGPPPGAATPPEVNTDGPVSRMWMLFLGILMAVFCGIWIKRASGKH